jgi:hypothetical protein
MTIIAGTRLSAGAKNSRAKRRSTGVRRSGDREALTSRIDESGDLLAAGNRFGVLITAGFPYSGELDGYWLGHPAVDPIDGRVVSNELRR